MSDSVKMLFCEKAYTPVVIEGAYCFAPKTGKVKAKLQRMAWDWLQRSGALSQAYNEQEKHEVVYVVFDDILEAVATARSQVYERTGRPPTRLILSAETFSEILGSPSLWRLASYASLEVYSHKLMGMKLEIVPWMDGWVVLP